ncbi:hypothetical protein ACWGH2_29195 [Streptomyces sp. NPDC054871]
MSSPQPERPPIHAAPAAGQAQPTDADRAAARRMIAALDEIPTRYVNDDPDVPSWREGARIGDAPVVEQPGTPSMTRRETQIGRVSLCVGAGVSMPILAGAVFMVATERANTAVIAWGAGTITSLALLVAAVGYFVRRIVAVAPPEIHNHIAGDMYEDRREVRAKTNALWNQTNINQ